MSYLALYRKYRPTDFEHLVGQEHIVKTLVNQIQNDRLGHAYLFTGTRGTGKTSCAKIFAKAINCMHPVNGSPCGECESCNALSDINNIDVVEIDAASNNGVNEIRDLREKVQYPPVSCKYKVYIIDEVHMLTISAFNALLKTLEEPPKHAIFILATTEVHKIPATILSRCMRFDFRLISTEEIAKQICEIFDDQGKEYEKEAIYSIAKAGEGSMRDALSIAEIALSYSNGKVTYKDVNDILGSTNFDVLVDFLDYLFNGDEGSILDSINSFSLEGKSMGVLLKDIVSFLRDILVIKTCNDAKSILNIPESNFKLLINLSETIESDRILRMMDIFSSAESTMRYSNHPRAVFETLCLKACKPENDYSIDSLIVRIKALEDKIESGDFEVKNERKSTISNKDDSQNVVQQKEIEKEKSFLPSDSDKVKGILLFNMREKVQSEMFFNILQGVNIVVNGGILILEVANQTDLDLLNSENAISKIKQALNEYNFNIEVRLNKSEQKLSEIDNATENIKKIFGEDIVIIKD